MIDPRDLADLIEERAAIIQEGDGTSRTEAENRAARLHGFDSWAAWKTYENAHTRKE